MLNGVVRSHLRGLLTKERQLRFRRRIPRLDRHFQEIQELGLYLHIPFCDQICPYCPYNREIYDPSVARRYAKAVKAEIDLYSDLLGSTPVTSFYIGGGTPTTMLHSGLGKILEHVFKRLNMQCDVHMESHPNHLTSANLDTIHSMGINQLSIGVESLQDRHLKTLNRTYTVDNVKAAVERSVARGFSCVNADVIFALPDQTDDEVDQTGQALVELGVDQVATYPLFLFPYTQMARTAAKRNYKVPNIFTRRRMLSILEGHFSGAGFRRTSVWAFTRPGVPRYCSVTVPLYVGLGASGGSYLKDVFYLNTFSVAEYINALESGRMPIAVTLDLSERMQMSGWLYWRIYQTRFLKSDFMERFGKEYDSIYGRYTKLLSLLGFANDEDGEIVLTNNGAYWLHALEDCFSIDYVSKLWGVLRRTPWPEKVTL